MEKKQKEVLNDLFDYGLKIYQYEDAFKFSLDSILLAEYVKLSSKIKNILDLCTGNAAVPLILSTKTNAKIDCYEIQEDIYNLGLKSIKYNQLDDQINIINKSIKYVDKNKKYDIITCNPPYFKVSNDAYINENEMSAIARHEITINLEDVFNIASNHLNDGGLFYLVHRAERLDEIIINASKYKINVKEIKLIKTKLDSKPAIVLVKCIKKSKYGVKIEDSIDISCLKTYQNIFMEDL